ncbi:MAG: peptidase T [Ignavibacteriae bacterium]|nr:peptidase T [Ignavibacteriota bacterium]
MKKTILNRFLKYISYDTQSDDASETCPSTQKQFDLANYVKDELIKLGLKDVSLDENCYLIGTLPANTDKKIPAIGFLAHFDTAPDMSGADIKPQIIENYKGGDILLKGNNLKLSPSVFPELDEHIGHTLITTDGTTLLGADDKAGITEIITAIEYLVNHPEIKHGTIKVGFTPDEEIGRGVDKFDVEKFKADFAYTMDGSRLGELEYENFNAAEAKIKINGRNVHPGYAKDKMLNAILIGMELNSLLPVNQRPEFTRGYDGFFHIIKFEGTVETSNFKYIIRDHDKVKFEQKKKLIADCVELLNKRYGEGVIEMTLKDQYFNMKEKVEPQIHIVETAKKAMEELEIEPVVVPIRGGTDGARLSYMGLPCPNIFAGGLNFHGKFEYVSLDVMEKATMVILKIIELYTKK